jgi:hypothetical protein
VTFSQSSSFDVSAAIIEGHQQCTENGSRNIQNFISSSDLKLQIHKQISVD